MSPTTNQVCLYELNAAEEHKSWQIAKKFQEISINCKRITSFAFDYKKQLLLLVREKKNEPDEDFEVYRIALRKNIDPRVKKKPLMVNMEVTDIAEVVARFNVFTTPLSVFTEDDLLTVSPYYVAEKDHVLVLICNSQFGLLYTADISS